MMTLFNLSTGIFESLTAFMLIKAYLPRTEKNEIFIRGILIAFVAVLINLCNVFLNTGVLNITVIVFVFFVGFYVYSKKVKMSLILAAMVAAILLIAEVMVMLFISAFADVNAQIATDGVKFRILGIVLSKLFGFFLIKVICIKHAKKTCVSYNGVYWLLFFVIFSVSTLAIYLLFILQYTGVVSGIYGILSVWCSVGLLYSTLFSLYLYENVSRQAELEKEHNMYQLQLKAQAKHLDEVLITQKEVRTLKHDMKNHVIALRSFFENKNFEDGLNYLNRIEEMQSIRDEHFDTGNTALDAILNTKKIIAQNKGIDFECNVQIPENIFVDAVDICIIFGNALDNCIEACELVATNEKYIKVSIVYDDALICKIVNSMKKESKPLLKTRKKDTLNHGIGLKSMERSIKKYGGNLKCENADCQFKLTFVLFNI